MVIICRFIYHLFARLHRINECQPRDLNMVRKTLCASGAVHTLKQCITFEGKSHWFPWLQKTKWVNRKKKVKKYHGLNCQHIFQLALATAMGCFTWGSHSCSQSWEIPQGAFHPLWWKLEALMIISLPYWDGEVLGGRQKLRTSDPSTATVITSLTLRVKNIVGGKYENYCFPRRSVSYY